MSPLFMSAHVNFFNTIIGRILIMTMGAFMTYGMTMMTFSGWPLPFRVACGIAAVGFATVVLMALDRKLFTSVFYAPLCIVLFTFGSGTSGGIFIQNWILDGSPNYYVPIAAFILCGIPCVWSALERGRALLSYIGLFCAFCFITLMLITESGMICFLGCLFALIAVSYPPLAVNIAFMILMIPLAAIGAGALGSWMALHD